jgi:deoxyadenosine/deoxycytidine kinase
MGTSIRLSAETKSMLAVLKDSDESWDEFLERLARRERDVEELAGFAEDEGVVEHMESKSGELSESLDENKMGRDDLSRQ